MIEALMAMAIFLIGFLAVSSMQISAVNGNTSARMRTSASILAGDIVEQLLRCPYESSGCTIVRTHERNGITVQQWSEPDPLSVGPHGPKPDDPDGDGPDRTYEVRWEVIEPQPGSKEIDVIVRWQAKGKNNSVQYTFIAADATL